MSHNIEISNLTDFNDIAFVKRLYDLNQANVPEVGSIETLKDFISLLKLSDQVLISYDHNKVTGLAVCFFEASSYSSLNYKYFSDNYDEFLYIDRIAINKNYRRAGVGSLMYEQLIKKYHKLKSIICCEVNIEPINQASLDFHARFNFIKVDEKDFSSHKVRYLVRKSTP